MHAMPYMVACGHVDVEMVPLAQVAPSRCRSACLLGCVWLVRDACEVAST